MNKETDDHIKQGQNQDLRRDHRAEEQTTHPIHQDQSTDERASTTTGPARKHRPNDLREHKESQRHPEARREAQHPVDEHSPKIK